MDHVEAPPELMETQPEHIAERLHPKTVIQTFGGPRGLHFQAWLYADNADQMDATAEALKILRPLFTC